MNHHTPCVCFIISIALPMDPFLRRIFHTKLSGMGQRMLACLFNTFTSFSFYSYSQPSSSTSPSTTLPPHILNGRRPGAWGHILSGTITGLSVVLISLNIITPDMHHGILIHMDQDACSGPAGLQANKTACWKWWLDFMECFSFQPLQGNLIKPRIQNDLFYGIVQMQLSSRRTGN